MPIRQSILRYCAIFLIFFACKKKEVQLPIIDIPGISEIQNHSSIWVFMKNQNGNSVAELNKNNKILNTHWIYNIDRRLHMKEVVPVLIEMQKNKNKDSMHKKGDMKSYFSYADTKSKAISLLLFPQTNFVTESSSAKFLEAFDQKNCAVKIQLLENEIAIDGTNYPLSSMISTLKKTLICDAEEKHSVLLMYGGSTSYQTYLQAKVYLHANGIHCEANEYFDTVK
jgi:hypothetical protein